MKPISEQDKRAVKALVALHGPREAARQVNIPEGTVLYWAKKYKWKKMAITRPVPRSVIGGKDAADLIRESMERHRENSTIHLAEYTANAAEKAAKHKDPLEVARKVRDVAGIYQVLYPPQSESQLIEASILVGEAQVTDNPEEIMANVKEIENVRQKLSGSGSTVD